MTLQQQQQQLEAATLQCRRVDSLLEKLDAAITALERCCRRPRPQLERQPEKPPSRQTVGEENLEKFVASFYEQLENELYQKLMQKLDAEHEVERMQLNEDLVEPSKKDDLQLLNKDIGQQPVEEEERRQEEKPDFQLDDEPERPASPRRRWRVAALCLPAALLALCGLLHCLWSPAGAF